MSIGPSTPVLRIFDERKAKEFYVDYLGFEVAWEHRFEDGLPLYLEVSRGSCTLHLSEHHGDCSPGAQVRIQCDDVDALLAELNNKEYCFARPGVDAMSWGTREMRIQDPFSNLLCFWTESNE